MSLPVAAWNHRIALSLIRSIRRIRAQCWQRLEKKMTDNAVRQGYYGQEVKSTLIMSTMRISAIQAARVAVRSK